MKEFFTEYGGVNFHIFGKLHIFLIIAALIIAIIMFKNRLRLRKLKSKYIISNILAIVLFINMLIYYVSMAILGVYDWHVHLPLHFCFITGYLLMLSVALKSKRLYSIIYFWTFIGPLPAIFLPDLTQGYNRFIFWQFIISHHLMLLTSLYVLFVLEYKIAKKNILQSFIIGNIMFMCIILFNKIMNTNYIMVGQLPDHIYRLFPFVNYLPPIFWLEFVGILALLIAYIPVIILKNSDSKSCLDQNNSK